jgi:hypothetical protein
VAIAEIRLGNEIAQALEIERTNQQWQAIDPDSRFSDYLHPMIGELFYQAFAGPQLFGRLRDSAPEAAELSIEPPRGIDRVFGEIERGNLRVWTLAKMLSRLYVYLSFTGLTQTCHADMLVLLYYDLGILMVQAPPKTNLWPSGRALVFCSL